MQTIHRVFKQKRLHKTNHERKRRPYSSVRNYWTDAQP